MADLVGEGVGVEKNVMKQRKTEEKKRKQKKTVKLLTYLICKLMGPSYGWRQLKQSPKSRHAVRSLPTQMS